jgi:hypothetical protein
LGGSGLSVSGGTGNAIVGDLEVVTFEGNSEETEFSPVWTPRVTANPVLLTFFSNTEADDWDLVVDSGKGTNDLGVNTTEVGSLEEIGSVDTAGDGAVSVELSLHLLNTWELVVLWDVVADIGLNREASLNARVIGSRWGPGAVTAHINGGAVVLKVSGSVLLAGRMDKTGFLSVLVHFTGVTSIAGATFLAVNNNLGVKTNGGVALKIVEDVESISDSGGGTLSPAWAAVLRNVLVLGPRHVVLAVHVSPVDDSGVVLRSVEVPCVGRGLDLGAIERGNLNAAASFSLGKEIISDVVFGVKGLRELVHSFVVKGSVLFFVGGDVSNTLGPGVLGSSPGAVGLDGKVVDTTADAEETTLTPVGTPGVTDSPELLTLSGDTVADDWNVVDDIKITSFVTEDTTSVVFESLGDGNTASDGAALVNFLHHGFLTSDGSELLSLVDVVGVGNEASLTGVAVSAVSHGGADTTVVEATTCVHRAGLVGDFVLGHPLECKDSITTVAAKRVVLAGNQNLGSDVDIGPCSISGDLDSVTEGGSGSVGPAGTAVLGDVLVADVGEEVGTVNIVPDPLFGELGSGESGLDLVLNGFGEGETAGVVDVDESRSGDGDASEGGNSERWFHMILFIV